MNVTVTSTLPASPEDVVRYVLTDGFLDDFAHASGDLVHEIEEVGREQRDEGLFREVRFRAPTRLPWILRSYRKKAPSEVSWDEQGLWDLQAHRFRYEIEPEMPDSWRDWYTSAGTFEVEPTSRGARVVDSLDFSLNVLGIGSALERALGSEIESLFEARKKALVRHFG